MTKFLILAIILCITVGVASATEASSDDTTAQDAPTITKNTPTTEKIITKTENKKINKNNKTQNVKKDTGDLYVSPDVTEAKTGTNEDPTTIIDAVSKVTQNGNIILLPGTTGVYTPTELITISDETTQSGTNKFSITAQNKNIMIDASQVVTNKTQSGEETEENYTSCLFKINSGYDITLNNVSISNAQAHAINITNANLTLNGEATYENCITPILRRDGTEYPLNSELQPKGGVITGSGNVNIKGSNTFKNNQAAGGGAVLSLSYGTLTITGQNLFVDNNIEDSTSTPSATSVPGLGYFGGLINTENVTIIINGSNKFTNNTYLGQKVFGGILYSRYGDCTIVGENEFINNHIEGTTTSMQGGVIYMYSGDRSSLNIIGSNKFEYNTGEINGGVIYISGTKTSESILNISGSNVFKNNEVRTNGRSTTAQGGVIYTTNIDKIVINGSNIFKNNEAWQHGGVLYSTGMHENANITITGNNLFENNSATGYTGNPRGSVFYIAINTGLTFTSTGSTYINNHADGYGMIYAIDSKQSNVSLIFLDNKFINNTSNQRGILMLSLNGTDENNEITIKNNIFEGNTAEDTTYISKPCKTSVENNTYINTPIAIDKINLTSDMENQEIGVNTPITLNINTTLIRPEGYETNITEQFEYQIYINDENKYNTTGNTITITEETEGTLNIYAKYGDYTSNNITITLISLKPGVNTTTENLTIGETTKLVATFFTDEGTPVTGGRAIFRVNGKTLRDEEGNVIYVDVKNGKAETPDVMITKEWMKPDTNIQALYSGTDEFTQIITEKTFIEVTKPEANIELTIPEEATAGQTITLKAKVTYEDALVTTGRVVFKLNGKTLKDENGKALYVNVENGIATTTYTIPAKTKAKTYTISAVFTDNNYLRSEKEENILVNK
jgi:hypothetical protein